MGLDEDEKSRSCCTWIKIGAVAVMITITGILIWRYAPINQAIDSVLPTFNTSTSGGATSNMSGIPGGRVAVSSIPTSSPTQIVTYNFMQCADPSSNCCNGLDNGFCNLRVDEVLWATSHNANADFQSGYLFSPNQEYPLEESMPAGYRVLKLDLCNCGGTLEFCHGVCSFGTRNVVDVFNSINTFVEDNLSEIMILPIEIDSNVDQPVSLDALYSLMQQVPGFVDKFYIHSNETAPWPTLGELVSSNQRVIVFQFHGPTCDTAGSCPPGLQYYYKYASNTQWNLVSVSEANDFNFSCTFAQTPLPGGLTFFGINNFVEPPMEAAAQTMNAYDYLATRVDACSNFQGGLVPNFIFVDFWNIGDLPRFVQERNAALAASRRLELD